MKKTRKNDNMPKRILIYILTAVLFFLSPAAYRSLNSNQGFGEELKKQFMSLQEFVINVFQVMKDSPYEGMLVHYIDVGQGDATLIQVDHKNILIDTGEFDESKKLIEYLKEQNVQTIDSFVITHPHSDHMGGAVRIMEEFQIGKIYMTNYVHTTRTYENLLKAIKNHGLKITRAKRGVEIDMGEDGSAVVLSPEKDYEDINASSIVLKVEYGRTSFLFAGDATVETEKNIMKTYPKGVLEDPLKVDVYKGAHHGSKTSNHPDYLMRLSPELCILSLGRKNSYGHPHKEVIKNLEKLGIKILRTDEFGTILVYTDGEKVSYELSKN